MAGLFAALSLRHRGWDAQIYERAGGALANRGAGIATHQPLYDSMRYAGLEIRDEMGVPSRGRTLLDASGGIVAAVDAPQIMTSWGLIYRFLRDQIPDDIYHEGHALEAVEPAGDGIVARFANGAQVEGDWLIAADGARSTARELVSPETALAYCGYFIWRGLFPETLVAPDVLKQVALRLTLQMAPGGHWLGYLVAGAEDEMAVGSRRYNWGWYRTAEESLFNEYLTDADGVFHPAGIPHDRVRPHWVDALRAEAKDRLAPQVQSIIEATRHPFLQGVYEVASKRMVYDRVIVIGDAAFTARPHVGLGVSKAAEDAVALSAALGDASSLARWETERLAYGQATVDWGRDLGAYCGPPPPDEARRAVALRHQQPEVLLNETGALHPEPYLARYL
jgi:2-polyprenyl-6-methoxyphenol hydroxylase-like FAD-dependent oxidoreductase